MWEAFRIILNEGKNSKMMKVSLSTLIIIIIVAFVFGGKAKFYKTQLDKIPTIEETLDEHKIAIVMIPDMKKGIDMLVEKFIDKGIGKNKHGK